MDGGRSCSGRTGRFGSSRFCSLFFKSELNIFQEKKNKTNDGKHTKKTLGLRTKNRLEDRKSLKNSTLLLCFVNILFTNLFEDFVHVSLTSVYSIFLSEPLIKSIFKIVHFSKSKTNFYLTSLQLEFWKIKSSTYEVKSNL